MGKVVKAVAVIAVAAAIAYFAPGIGLGVLHAFGSTAVAGSFAATLAGTLVAATLAAAASVALQAFSPKPHTSTAPGRQASRGQPLERDGFAWRHPADPEKTCMEPIGERWWRDPLFLPWQRVAVRAVRGNCLAPTMTEKTRWVVVDRRQPITRDDFLLLKPDDLRAYHAAAGTPMSGGLIKRFVGVDPQRKVIVYETTNPPNRIETGLDRIMHAYRVVSWHRSWSAAMLSAWHHARSCKHPLDTSRC